MTRRAREWIDAGRFVLGAVGEYFRLGRARPTAAVASLETLAEFLDSRASFVAQSALYGYLRTRAGMRYPVLFDDDAFVASINTAKWYLWLACLSDLAVYAGGLVASRTAAPAPNIGALMRATVGRILARTGTPADAGPRFVERAAQLDARLAACDWHRVGDDESAFTESPAALVEHAPIVRELMALDEEIVRNSVRFRWHEVRRDLRRALDAGSLVKQSGGTA